jgi:hypothetical protein
MKWSRKKIEQQKKWSKGREKNLSKERGNNNGDLAAGPESPEWPIRAPKTMASPRTENNGLTSHRKQSPFFLVVFSPESAFSAHV